MDKKKEKPINAKRLESHNKRFTIIMDGVENVKTDFGTIAEIEEAYANGARVLMGISNGTIIVETSHDFLKASSFIDVTNQLPRIIIELRKRRISYETRLMLQDKVEVNQDVPVIVFEVERQVKWMMEDLQTLKEWMDSRKKIWRISMRNSKGILLAVAYIPDQKWFDWMKEWMDCFMSRKQTYLHHTRIQPLYKQTLVNPRAAKLFVSDLQRSGFIPVKSAQEEYKKIQQIMRTAAWVNGKVKKNEGTK